MKFNPTLNGRKPIMSYYIRRDERIALQAKIKDQEFLVGKKEIAAYLGLTYNSVGICIKWKGMPAIKGLAARGDPVGNKQYRTTKTLLNRWIIHMYGEWLVRTGLIPDPNMNGPLPMDEDIRALNIPEYIINQIKQSEAYHAEKEAEESNSN